MKQKAAKMCLKTSINDSEVLKYYLEEKGKNHNCYKTYSTLERIESWKKSNCFYLDDGSRWNDPSDRDMFNNDNIDVKRFGRCFSFSRNESVAMWMLYGGMTKSGVMLEFKGSAMRELIKKTKSVEFGNWKNGKFEPVLTLNEGQYLLELKDILYRDKRKSGRFYIRRSDEVCKTAPGFTIRKLDHCVKAAAWSYENECRLVLSVDKRQFPEILNTSSARIHLHDMLKNTGKESKDTDKVRIYCSPNFFADDKPYLESNIKDDIDWDLCAGCKKTSVDT